MSFRSASQSISGAATAGAIRARRPFGAAVSHVPQTLRALVRADEIWLVVLAASVGVAAGGVVVAMAETAQLMHRLLFRLATGEFLSSQVEVETLRALLVPSLGGLALGLAGILVVKWSTRRTIDPIEANALYGGT